MTAPGVGPITAMAVVATFDDASRFRRSSSAGAYLGLTPRRYESGEISRNGRVSRRGDGFTRKCLFEAANAIYCRNLGGPRLRDRAMAIAVRTGPRKAKVALARKIAILLRRLWLTGRYAVEPLYRILADPELREALTPGFALGAYAVGGGHVAAGVGFVVGDRGENLRARCAG